MKLCANGAWAAALTPLNEDQSINQERSAAHLRWLFDQGLDGVAILGTTGEANSFSVQERADLIESTADANFPNEKIMVGVGCCSAPDTIALSRASIDAGYHNILMLPPFFYKGVSEEGLFVSYARIIEQLNDSRAKIFIYDIPPMTGLDMSVDLMVRLYETFPDNIAGVKDSSGRWEDMKEACQRLPNCSIFAGTEKYLLPILRAGGAGCISATANVTGSLLAQLMNVWEAPGADQLQDHITKVRLALQAYPAVPALKEIMAISQQEESWRNIRPPINSLNDGAVQNLLDDLQNVGFDVSKFKASISMAGE